MISLPSHVLPRDEGRVWTIPQDSVNGSFIFPRIYPLTLREGSSINISWVTTYENINLYFYQRGKVANSVQLGSECRRTFRCLQVLMVPLANLATEWYQWDVRAEERNLTNPFVFRIVNAQGTTEEQNTEGFWSTSWYLSRDGELGDSAIPLSSAVSSTTGISSTTSLSSSISSWSPYSTVQETKTEATAAVTAAAEVHDKGIDKGTVTGLTVGLVVLSAIAIAGLLYCFRKRKERKDASSFTPTSAGSCHDKTRVQKHAEYHTMHEVFAQPSELQGISPCYELPSQK